MTTSIGQEVWIVAGCGAAVNPADRRSKLVRITTAGRAVARRAQRIQSAPPAVLESLPTEELAALERTLRSLVERSEQAQ